MQTFLDKHQPAVTGVVSCFDRVIFKGHLSLNLPHNLEVFLAQRGWLLKDFKTVAPRLAEQLKQHAQQTAHAAGRPYIYLDRHLRKEDLVSKIADDNGVTRGLICVLAAVESCTSFKLVYGQGKPRLERARRKCLCVYYYFQDRVFGRMHVRVQTWFPFMIQVYINGHDWLVNKLDCHGIDYRRCDNALLWVADPQRVQRFADRLATQNWPRILDAFARKVNPLLANLINDESYYWVIDQAEYATDVLFRDRQALKDLYPALLKHATHCFSAEDVLTFLGRKLNGNFKGEVTTDYKVRVEGARIKHRMKENWIKMYDKHGCVLRIETVINRPSEFRVRRKGRRRGAEVLGWFPMAKGVANMGRYMTVALAANRRYLQALAAVRNPAQAYQLLAKTSRPARKQQRSYRGFNPINPDDLALFKAVMHGEHAIHGFRNRDLRRLLFPTTSQPEAQRQHSAHVSRLIKRLHIHGLIAKFPRSRRWRITKQGAAVFTLALTLHDQLYLQQRHQTAA